MTDPLDSTRDMPTSANVSTVFDSSMTGALGRFGDFALQAEVGTDGPFTLYRARQPKLNRTVLLKLPTDREAAHENEAWFLRREAEMCARLDHPVILRVLEFGECQGVPYLAFAAVEGQSLAGHLLRGPVSAHQAANWIRQLTEALFTAHRQQVTHGNLRPEYVFVQPDGTLRLTGFGTSDRPVEIHGYLSPERLPGFSRQVDGRADVYGLGALLYALLTGRPPHSADGQAKLTQALRAADIIPPRTINPRINRDLECVCLQCLVREPFRRYGGDAMKRLLFDCPRFLSGRPVLARAGLWWRAPALWVRRNRRALATPVVIALGVLLPWLWQEWRTASAWQTLLTEPSVAEWLPLSPMDCTSASAAKFEILKDQSVFVASVPADEEAYTLRTTIPADVRAIQAIRFEALPDERLPSQGPGLGNGRFAITDLQFLVGEPDLERPVPLQTARADKSQPGFPASAAIDEDATATGWAIGSATGQAHTLELIPPKRFPVLPGEPLTITMRFGLLPQPQLGRFRFSIRGDAPQAAGDQQRRAEAEQYFQKQFALRPHSDDVMLGQLISRLRSEGEFPSLVKLSGWTPAMDPATLLQPSVPACVDPRWNRTWRQIVAIAALRDGSFLRASTELALDTGKSPGVPWLDTEIQRLRTDPDIIARAIDLLDSEAIARAKDVPATDELVRALLQRQVNYMPPTTWVPERSRPLLMTHPPHNVAFITNHAEPAAWMLQQIAFDWPDHPGARAAIPVLAEQLADANEPTRKTAHTLLNEIDPQWHLRPEARRAIPGLVLRTAGLGESPDPIPAEALNVLNQIDRNWQKTPEAQKAIPVLMDILRALAANEPNGYGAQTIRPGTQELLFQSDSPWTAVDVLLQLGTNARPAAQELVLLTESSRPDVRNSALAAMIILDPKWSQGGDGQQAVARLLDDVAADNAETAISSAATLERIGGKLDAAQAIPQLMQNLPEPAALKAIMAIDANWEKSEAAKTAIPALRKQFNESHPQPGDLGPNRRVRALWTLAKLGPASAPAVPDLIDAVDDTQQAISLDPLSQELFTGCSSNSPVGLFAMTTLDAVDPKWPESQAARQAIPRLIQNLPEPTAYKAIMAIDANWATSEAAKAAIPALRKQFNESHPQLGDLGPNHRVRALWTLAKLGSASAPAVPDLIDALDDTQQVNSIDTLLSQDLGCSSNSPVGLFAMKTLDAVDPKWPESQAARQAIPRLLEAVAYLPEDYSERYRLEYYRRELQKVIDRIDPQWRTTIASHEIKPTLLVKLRPLGARPQDRRGDTIAMLLWFGQGPLAEDSAHILGEWLLWAPNEYQRETLAALEQIGPTLDEKASLIGQLDAGNDWASDHRDKVTQMLDRIDPKWRTSAEVADRVPNWAAQLQDTNSLRQWVALEALGRVGAAAEPALPAISTLIGDDYDNVSIAAIRLLASFPPAIADATPALIAAAQNETRHERAMEAVRTLGFGGRPAETIPALIPLLGKGGLPISLAAFESLERLDPKWHQTPHAQTFLTEWEADWKNRSTSPSRALKTAGQLGWVGPENRDLVDELIERWKDPTNLPSDGHRAVGFALGMMGPRASEAAPALLAFLEAESYPSERTWVAIWAIGRMQPKPEKAIPVILKVIPDFYGWRVPGELSWQALDRIDPQWGWSKFAADAEATWKQSIQPPGTSETREAQALKRLEAARRAHPQKP